MTTDKHERTGDGVNFVQNYTYKLQYRTYRTVVTPSQLPETVRRDYGFDKPYAVTALVRFDDDCGNGHCTLSVTGEIPNLGTAGRITEVLTVAFPELRDALKYHLVSTDGPMHYPANVLYLAGDRDHNGKRAGEVARYEHGVRFGDSPVTHKIGRRFAGFLQERIGTGEFQVTSIAHSDTGKPGAYQFAPKYTLVGYGEKWHDCPFDSQAEANEFALALNTCKADFVKIPVEYSTGKARELDSARRTAIWPDATDMELSQDPEALKQALMDRLPALMADFRKVVEDLGFDYDFPAEARKSA